MCFSDLTLTISIINYRTGDMTLACVRSVLDDLGGIRARVVVVDNRSDDGSAEQIEAWIEAQEPHVPVTLVRSAENSGFSGGHNQGMATAPAQFYLILNSDALIRPGFFAALLASARTHPDAGFFSPRLEYEDGTQQISCFRFHSPASELIRGAVSRPVTRLLARYDIPLRMPPAADQVDWASFACILLRGTMVDQVGPMDEGYFLYFEDTEYCLRARGAGWGIIHVPEACAIHFRGGSAPVKSLAHEKKRLPAYYYASRTRFFRQAYGPLGLLAANLLWHLGRVIAQARRILGKPVPATNAHEARDLWINSLTPLGDNRKVM